MSNWFEVYNITDKLKQSKAKQKIYDDGSTDELERASIASEIIFEEWGETKAYS
jgi:hypothetical protein